MKPMMVCRYKQNTVRLSIVLFLAALLTGCRVDIDIDPGGGDSPNVAPPGAPQPRATATVTRTAAPTTGTPTHAPTVTPTFVPLE